MPTNSLSSVSRPIVPSWFTPIRLLLIFCVMNMFVYLDRGVIASNGVNGSPKTALDPSGSGVQGQFDLSNIQDGLLPAAFMVGLLVASPIFAEASKHGNAFRLIGMGMGIWTLATFGCGLSMSFSMLLLCRMFVGMGEASFVSLAAPFIDDNAPPAKKSQWFAAFYLCIPVGVALGYIYGGLVGSWWGWRAAFLLESLAMLPFVVFMFVAQPIQLHGTEQMEGEGEGEGEVDEDGMPLAARKEHGAQRSVGRVVGEFLSDCRTVLSQRVWTSTVCAYVMYTAVLGVYAYWGPKAGAQLFHLAKEKADVVFGAVTVMTGIIGVVGGGVLLDTIGANLKNAALMCAFSAGAGWALSLLSFLASPNFSTFIVLFAVAELALFMSQAPVVALGMWSVPPQLRPLAISLTTLAIHVFGDVPSPPLLGFLQDFLSRGLAPEKMPRQWRFSLSIMTQLLLLSAIGFLLAAKTSKGARDYRFEEGVDSPEGEIDGLAGGHGGGNFDTSPLLFCDSLSEEMA